MGHPFFTWYPHSQYSNQCFLSLGEDLSDLQVTPTRQVSDAITLSGRYQRTSFRASQRVRIVLERFTDRHMFRQLTNMVNHLERGGWVAFGNDDTKAWGAGMTLKRLQGSAAVTVGPNQFNDYSPNTSSSFVPVASTSSPYGDELVFETTSPGSQRDMHPTFSCTATSGTSDGSCTFKIDHSSSAVTNSQLRMDYPVGAMVRVADFWPRLYMPAAGVGTPIIAHDHRIAYTFDIVLQSHIFDVMAPDLPPVANPPEQADPQGSGTDLVIVPKDQPDNGWYTLGDGTGYWKKTKITGGMDPIDVPMLKDILK